MKLKIVAIDHYGYNGREHPPADSDIMTTVVVIGLDVQQYDEEGGFLGPAKTIDFIVEDNLEYCWTCVTPDGRTVELMGHEVEVVTW